MPPKDTAKVFYHVVFVRKCQKSAQLLILSMLVLHYRFKFIPYNIPRDYSKICVSDKLQGKWL